MCRKCAPGKRIKVEAYRFALIKFGSMEINVYCFRKFFFFFVFVFVFFTLLILPIFLYRPEVIHFKHSKMSTLTWHREANKSENWIFMKIPSANKHVSEQFFFVWVSIRSICIAYKHSILLIADTMKINDKICCNHFSEMKFVIFNFDCMCFWWCFIFRLQFSIEMKFEFFFIFLIWQYTNRLCSFLQNSIYCVNNHSLRLVLIPNDASHKNL